MKKMILPTICFLALAGTAFAQTRNSRRRGSTTTTSAVSPQTQAATARLETDFTSEVRQSSRSVIPDNRKEYMIDGQLATYTGHQATPVNSDEFQSLRKEDDKKQEN